MRMVSITGTNQEQRKSTLVLEPGGEVRVMGVLPHNYGFKPSTPEDAATLAAHLTGPPPPQGMKLVIEIELDNAAFQDGGTEEVQRILDDLLSRLPEPLDGTGGDLVLHDINGNYAGKARIQ
jgi:hypothetical protein